VKTRGVIDGPSAPLIYTRDERTLQAVLKDS
jgi:hypothetical protein